MTHEKTQVPRDRGRRGVAALALAAAAAACSSELDELDGRPAARAAAARRAGGNAAFNAGVTGMVNPSTKRAAR